jgi:thiol-disulfide isomerase/thioredoxin
MDGSTSQNQINRFIEASKKFHSLILSGRSFSGHERNCVYLNTGNARQFGFANVSAITGFDFVDDGRGMATVDWDFDGDLDLWISNRTGPRLRFLRNDIQTANHFLAMKLTGNGVTCNRDAIGARLELTVNGVTLLRTLKAGEGYLSQSTKWIHFGLGQAETVDTLVVRWPDGSKQTLAGLEVDQFYQLAQGQSKAVRWLPQDRHLGFQPTLVKARKSSEKARLILATRTPLPRLSYIDMEGKSHDMRELLSEGPLLLNLWASWCMPCQTELSDLNKAGVHLLALSVDGLDDQSPTTHNDARQFLKSHSYTFAAGFVNPQLMQMLQLYCRALYDDHRPFPVPISFLIDTQGQVTAIYKGAVNIKQINQDIAHLNDPPDTPQQLRQRAIPFNGRWLTRQPANLFPTGLADQMINEDLLDEAIDYLTAFGSSDINHPYRQAVMKKLMDKLHKQGRHELMDQLKAKVRPMESQRLPSSPN